MFYYITFCSLSLFHYGFCNCSNPPKNSKQPFLELENYRSLFMLKRNFVVRSFGEGTNWRLLTTLFMHAQHSNFNFYYCYTVKKHFYFGSIELHCSKKLGSISTVPQDICLGPFSFNSRFPWILEGPGRSWRILEGPGGSWRVLEGLGGPWRVLEGPGGSWRLLKAHGGS
jgi:hypothetical protein